MKIYLASSWKNELQVNYIAGVLRREGHEVDAFCDKSTGRYVFGIDDIGADTAMTLDAKTALQNPLFQKAFAEDKSWIDWADAVLLILPAGKSSHLEAG